MALQLLTDLLNVSAAPIAAETVGNGAFECWHELDMAMESVGAKGITYSNYTSVNNAIVTSVRPETRLWLSVQILP